jgi:hypothetical protein
MKNKIEDIDFGNNHKKWVEIYHSHEVDGHDGGSGFHTWQKEIFNRILDHIGDDEEARVAFLHTIAYAESQSSCSGI